MPTPRQCKKYDKDSGNIKDHTIDFWGSRLGLEPTEEDARTIIQNVISLFQILDEWDRGLRDNEGGD